MLLAKMVSVRSTCNSRKIGAVIVRNNRILATGYNGAVHGAPHCTDKGPDFCFRRTVGAHDGEKYNYCVSSHAEVNAVDQAARFGIPLEGASVYCTLEPCNWCFKQLIQAGVKEIYYERPYDSKNKEFDRHWRKTMESHEGITRIEMVKVSQEAVDQVIQVITGQSERRLPATEPDEEGELNMDALAGIIKGDWT
jgi:dCMP deaminase